MQVAPGVHHFETFPFNWYVLEEAGRLSLVDAGFPGHYDVFRAGLRLIGRELRDVKAVVLTHIHANHTGFAERVRRELGVPAFVHEDDLPASRHVRKIPPSGSCSTSGGPSCRAASWAPPSARACRGPRASPGRRRSATATCSTCRDGRA